MRLNVIPHTMTRADPGGLAMARHSGGGRRRDSVPQKQSKKLPRGPGVRNLGLGLEESRGSQPEARSGAPHCEAKSWNPTARVREGEGQACHQKEGGAYGPELRW